MRNRSIAIFLIVAVLLEPHFSFAQSGGACVLALSTVGSEDSVMALKDRLRSSRLEVPEIESSKEEANPNRIDALQASENLKQAKLLYKSLKLKEALEAIHKARKNADYVTFRESFFLEALIGLLMRNNDQMAGALAEFVLLGGAQPDEAYYPAKLIKAFRAAKQRISSRPAGLLEIRPEVANGSVAEIWVNGARVGVGNIQSRNLRIGIHHVEVRAIGYQSYGQVVLLKEEGAILSPKPVAVSLKNLSEMALASSGSEKHTLWEILERRAQAKGILLVGPNELKVVKGGSEILSRPMNHPSQLSEEDVLSIERAILPPMALQLDPKESPLPIRRSEQSMAVSEPAHFYQKWWFWTLIGAAAAGGGAYAYVGQKSSTGTVQLSVGVK